MALLNFLKKPEEDKKKKASESKPVLDREKLVSENKEKSVKRQMFGLASEVLISPHITEKATNLNEESKYIFKIQPKSNKIGVKKAIESVYGVDVIDVRIINIPRRKRRVGKTTGWAKGYKKAIIKIKKGQKIEILSH